MKKGKGNNLKGLNNWQATIRLEQSAVKVLRLIIDEVVEKHKKIQEKTEIALSTGVTIDGNNRQ